MAIELKLIPRIDINPPGLYVINETLLAVMANGMFGDCFSNVPLRYYMPMNALIFVMNFVT